MIYVMSDLHGYSDKYLDFLDAVDFSEKDILYIIGDVIDRGLNGIRILMDIMERDNVIMLKGNHEHMMLPILEELCYGDKGNKQEIINDSLAIEPIGQESTLNAFCQLSKKEQVKILDYLSSLGIYKEITVNSRKFLLVHAGLPDFEEKYDLEYYTEEELLFGEHNFDIYHLEDTIVIVGHVPTRFLNGAEPDEIFRSNDSICMDCGLGFGGQLGVLCLDNDEEFYF